MRLPKLPRCFQEPWVRIGVQVAAGTLIILAACTPYTAWTSLSLDPVVATPAVCLLLYCVHRLLSIGSGLSTLQVVFDITASTLLGVGQAMGIGYAAKAINGGQDTNTTTRASVTICLTCGWVFIATLSRFRFVKYNVFWLFNLVTLGLTVSANYRTHYPLWKFPVHWLYYGFIAVGGGMLASQFVFPVLAGNIIRAALGRSLRAVGSAFARAIELMTGEVDEATGLLAQRSGDTAGVSALYDDVTVAGAGINEIWKWQNAARYEWDTYRRQHWFPHAHFDFLAHLLRSTMNSFMMVVYPLQTGRMDCRVTRRHAGSLRALGGAVAGCCEALAAVLADGRPLAEAAPALEAMEARYEALVDEAERALLGASGAGAALSARMVSYNMMVATFFTVCTRLRRMYLCSAGALGRDDPGALAVLERHFHPDQRAQRGADVGWHFATIMRRIHVGRGSLNSPLGLLRDSLLSEQSLRLAQKAGAPQQLQDYLKAWRPPVLKVMAVQEKESISRWARFLTWLRLRTGINTNHLALACQGTAGFAVILVMVVVPQVNAAMDNRMLWALFIVITILEPFSGALLGGVILKGSQRILGTALGVALGLTALYFTYLCNGLSYDNDPLKFIIMTASLMLFSGGISAGSVKYPKFFYGFLIADMIVVTTALPGYHETEPMPRVALWRMVTTFIGVAVNIILACTLFPVSAKSMYEARMVQALEGLAEMVDYTCHCIEPRQHRRGRARRRRPPPPDPAAAQELAAHNELSLLSELSALEPQSRTVSHLAPNRERLAQVLLRVGHQDPPAALSTVGKSGEVSRGTVATSAGLGLGGAESAETTPILLGEDSEARGLDSYELAALEGRLPAKARTYDTACVEIDMRRELSGNAELQSSKWDSIKSFLSTTLRSPATRREDQLPEADVSFKVMGGQYLKAVPRGKPLALNIGAMAALEQALHYEYYPFSKVKRFPFVPAMRAQRLCRHMLNVLFAFLTALDSQESQSAPALIPVAAELRDVVRQLKACLLALAGIVKGSVPTNHAIDMVINLDELTQYLFLAAMARCDFGALPSEDVVLGVTYLAMLFNATYVVQVHCVALVQAFKPDDVEALAHASLLTSSPRWAVDEQLMVLCNDMMAMAMYPEVDLDGDDVEAGAGGVGGPAPAADGAAQSSWEHELASAIRMTQ
ncbi:hypothetical protein QBZ16_002512 [Prototheca wickerhamii]|uniref:Integral membrane bound transporter domain-containing protein n=1 Tax=Prototheca wickerhamii TaxID=3111 RepID=A0AAD9MP19_PROWI|nr:hypothetical protein QBZ16_002512 [Prototheca wickerhamii]